MIFKNPTTSWDLKPLLKGDTDPNLMKELTIITEANMKFIQKWSKREDYLVDDTVLLEALTEYEALQRVHGTSGSVGYYFSLRKSQDTENPAVSSGYNMIHQFSTKLYNEIQFFELRLATISSKTLSGLLKNKQLKPFEHFLQRLCASAPFLLSDKEERILNLKTLPAHESWVTVTSKLLSSQEREVLGDDGVMQFEVLETMLSNLQSSKEEVRNSSAIRINEILKDCTTIAEAELNAILANKEINDQLRGYTRPDQSRHISDDMSPDTIDTLVSTVTNNYQISHRFYALKAQLLGKDLLEYHERSAPYGSPEEGYSYETSLELVHKTLSKLDPQFGDILEKFIEGGQFDVFPRKNKRGGAFCAHDLVISPTYILLNHTGSLRDVLTLAHEVGHGINNELTRTKQHSLYFGTSMATAEVASTFMEDFVLGDILGTVDDEKRLSLLMTKLNDDISTIFRQIACYTFEMELHTSFRKSQFLSHTEIGTIFQKHMSSYMGPAVKQSPGSENWWIYWSHIRSFFYVYSYASGLLISKSLQKSVKENPSFIHPVKDFLSAGISKSPADIFKSLGVSISSKEFWEKGLQEISQLLDEATALAKKLGKL